MTNQSYLMNVLITLQSSVWCCPCINSRWQQRVSFYLFLCLTCGWILCFFKCQFQRCLLLTCPRKTHFKAYTHKKICALFVLANEPMRSRAEVTASCQQTTWTNRSRGWAGGRRGTRAVHKTKFDRAVWRMCGCENTLYFLL